MSSISGPLHSRHGKIYSIQTKLGSGASGNVYLVLNQETHSPSALKKSKNSSGSYIGRDIVMSLAADQIRHVVHSKDFVSKKTHYWMVMELVGPDAKKRVLQKNLLDTKSFVLVAKQGLELLADLKARGLVHSDIKPENLSVEKDNQLKLFDLGLMRFIGNITKEDFVGTRFYQAPEMLERNNLCGYPMDMWSLGCVLFELYTGEPLCQGDISQQLRVIEDQLREDGDLIANWKRRIFYAARSKQETARNAKTVIAILDGMLRLNPEIRVSPEQGIQHPVFQSDIGFELRLSIPFLNRTFARLYDATEHEQNQKKPLWSCDIGVKKPGMQFHHVERVHDGNYILEVVDENQTVLKSQRVNLSDNTALCLGRDREDIQTLPSRIAVRVENRVAKVAALSIFHGEKKGELAIFRAPLETAWELNSFLPSNFSGQYYLKLHDDGNSFGMSCHPIQSGDKIIVDLNDRGSPFCTVSSAGPSPVG